MTTNHFKEAERLLKRAESAFSGADEAGYPEGNTDLNRAHYYLQFANAHTILAQVQAQTTVYVSVDKMADALTPANKEDK